MKDPTKDIQWLIRTQVSRYVFYANARAASFRRKAGVVLHGDDGMYWVTTWGVASRMERAGYEVCTL
jgi:hypothetical protein